MSKTIIVSNRLPVKVQKKENKLIYKGSEGGLATGLGSIYKQEGNRWLGWPGLHLSTDEEMELVAKELYKDNLFPVFLSKKEIEQFYEGFCNETLWPTLHYFPQYIRYNENYWKAYAAVNRKFCKALAEILEPGDTVWIHDYQLLLLPQMVRELFPEINIGFFQHVPFPSSEIFRLLPWREQLLKGMLGADLIGFHTYDDMRHFLSSVHSLLGINNAGGQLDTGERIVLVDAFPMGIDYDKYAQVAASKTAINNEKRSRSSFGTKKFILSIDRLDYSKGIPQRLQAFDLFLKKYPNYREKVSLIQIVVPSRDKVEKYRQLKEEVNELVGSLNSSLRTIDWNPVVYFYRSFPIEMLSAFYRMADVALVTPMRDGMNLVCKEYIASKLDQKGALVLSELAGASKELSDAILVNPNDTNQMADAIYTALTFSDEEQVKRMKNMQQTIKRFNIGNWVKLFMERLSYIKEKQRSLHTKKLEGIHLQKLQEKYQASGKRLIFLDYDGTLTSFKNNPDEAKPDAELLKLLDTLCQDPKNKIVIISGRERNILEQWMGHLPVDFIAEHGVWMKYGQENNWYTVANLTSEWKQYIFPIMEHYVNRTPGAFIEEKDYSLVWHYRKVQVGLGDLRTRELSNHLKYLIFNMDLQVLEGDKVLEIKSAEVNKGRAALQWLEKYTPDFILAMGDDWTDEDIFKAMPDDAFTVRVRSTISAAKYNVTSYEDVRALLKGLVYKQSAAA